MPSRSIESHSNSGLQMRHAIENCILNSMVEKMYLQNEIASVLVYADAFSLLQHFPAFLQLKDEFRAEIDKQTIVTNRACVCAHKETANFTSVSNGRV